MLIKVREFRGEMKNKIYTKLIAISFSLLFVVASATYFDTSLKQEVSASSIDHIEDQALDAINDFRNKNNLNTLVWDERLAAAAREKLNDQDNLNYFDHTSPEGKKAWDFILEQKYNYKSAGENLAIDFENVSDAMIAWENSPTHKENMISKKYEDFGFAYKIIDINGIKSMSYVQMFGTEHNIYDRVF